ncbi:MAG: Ig-like domain-containing protein [Duncaniella sp.]|nr:Ig-like domain-containing protein [Duncaniella sp.]
MLVAAAWAMIAAACANMGRPEGGPRDETPPVYVGSTPSMGQLNFNRQRIMLEFDENVSLDDAMSKVIVSPAQKNMPAISNVGRRVYVELRDSLRPNTTYTIDFADAIKDLNEGNILDGMALDFSTGDTLDTLCISGRVFQARNLEPAQGMLVGVYSNLSDTALTTLPMERITKTNQRGEFTVRNMAPGTYRIFAVNDVNRDYHWDRSEDVAFYDVTLTPSAEPATVTDTLLNHAGIRDSLVTRGITRFLPDDVLLTWFNEEYTPQYLKEYKRPAIEKLTFTLSAKADTLPRLRLVNTPRAGQESSEWAVVESSATMDTLVYWITDSAIYERDSLTVALEYMKTDTLGGLSLATDTLKMNVRGPMSKKKRDEEARKKRENFEKEVERILKINADTREKNRKKIENQEDTLEWADLPRQEVKHLDLKLASPVPADLHKPLMFKSPTPIASVDTTGLRLEMEIDSVWYPAGNLSLRRARPLNPLVWVAPVEWESGQKYRLTVDSAAFTDIYGISNKYVQTEILAKSRSDYSTLSFNISGLDGRRAVVELLNTSDAPVTAVAADSTGGVRIEYINPGTYYARLFIDTDGDSLWTTGSIASLRQPEEVYYYPRKFNLKKNWDIEQEWNINELPVEQQKPYEIVKNKPKKKKGEQDPNASEEEEEDEFFDDPFMQNATRNNGLGGGQNNMIGGRFRNTSNISNLAR